MFAGKSLLDIVQLGGTTMWVLLLLSLVSIAIFLERLYYYRKQSALARGDFMAQVADALATGDTARAESIAAATGAPYARVILAGLRRQGKKERAISGAMECAIVEETRDLERFTGIVGAIGNVGVYVGLFGTVLGIIHAFQDIAATGVGGMSTVIEGVAEALICTATGLMVAIPAVIFFSYFTKRVESFTDDMQVCATELLCLLEENQ